MNNTTVSTNYCPGCDNDRRRNRDNFDTPVWGPGPNSGPWRRQEPWGPPYPGPFGPYYWGGLGWSRLDPWKFRPYQPGFGPGASGPRIYWYGPR